jgi:hypothetical protein
MIKSSSLRRTAAISAHVVFASVSSMLIDGAAQAQQTQPAHAEPTLPEITVSGNDDNNNESVLRQPTTAGGRLNLTPLETPASVAVIFAAERGVGILIAIHDLALAARFADRLVMLKNGRNVAQGRWREVLTPDRIEAVYGVSAVIGSADGLPYVIPVRNPNEHGVF